MERPLQIAFKDTESSEFLEGLIRERVERLNRFHPRIIGCRVVVYVPHRSAESGKLPLGVSVEVDIPGRSPIIAKAEEERRDAKGDNTVVVNRVFEAVQRQLESVNAIQAGEVKQHGAAMDTGNVVRLFPEQNYGFIEVRGAPDLYFTRNAVVDGSFDDIVVGTIVQFTRATTEGPMGPQASSVRLLNALKSAS